MTEPWTPGSLPTDCPHCGTVAWIGPPFERPECCGELFRFGGADSRPWAWYVDVCQRVRDRYRAEILRMLEESQ